MCGALELYLQAQIRFSLKPIENSTDSNHAVYSHDIIEQLMELSDYMNTRKIRFDSKFKIKTSFYSSTIEDEILQEMGFEPEFDLEKLVEKPIEAEVRVECYEEAMTGEFSQFEENSVYHSNSLSSFAAGSARVQVNLEVDPVLHGWTKALRLINYLLVLPKRLKHKLHLVPDQNCQICEVGDMKWDPTVIEQDAERSLFRYETKVIKKNMKPELVQEFEEIDEILYYQGRLAQENQLKPQDLDGCKFLDFIEIVVLEDSPDLYSYIMWIHMLDKSTCGR